MSRECKFKEGEREREREENPTLSTHPATNFFLFFSSLLLFCSPTFLPNKMTGFYSEIVSSSGAYKAFIDGEWRESTSGKTVAISNPTTEATAFTVQGKLICFLFGNPDPGNYD